jgi:hypothetical protein
MRGLLQAIAFSGVIAAAGVASATNVTVDSHAGPWDPTISGNFDYGIHDNIGPASIGVTAGTNYTVSYLSGLTSAFGGSPVVDATGYVGSIFGTGFGESQTGSSGTYFPSFPITGALGPPVYLNALIGDFVDASGVVLSAFAPGNGPFTVTAPVGAVALQFGVNDDIFFDNTGALVVGVNVAGVPEPASWVLMLVGFGGLGAALRSRRRQFAVRT